MTFGQTAEEPEAREYWNSKYLDIYIVDSCAMIHSAGKTSSATRPLIKIRPVLMSGPPLLRQCRHDRTLDSDNATLWPAPYFA